MGYCENNAILYTNIPSKVLLYVYDNAGNLEEVREIIFDNNNEISEHGIYYYNQNGRLVPTRDLINSVDV